MVKEKDEFFLNLKEMKGLFAAGSSSKKKLVCIIKDFN